MRPESEVTLHDFEPDIEKLRKDVLQGLLSRPKRFPSQYLYDERGARLFERICETREYYLTRTEVGILERHKQAIAQRVGPGALVIEPGSGSGLKTRMLLAHLDRPAGYVPIDVAKGQLSRFAAELERDFPDIEVLPVCADFTSDYEIPPCDSDVRQRVTYFPGSTIGNFTPDDAVDVLRHMLSLCEGEGGVLIGVDLRKDKGILEPAYDDADGYSRAFALNILTRLNRELDADFNLDQFGYAAPYNDKLGRVEMAIVSLCRQTVRIGETKIEFEALERAATEYSYKYSLEGFAELAHCAGLHVERVWTDPDELFSIQFLRPAD